MEKIGTPTFAGIKEAAIDYALGFGGGLLYKISTAIFGSGLIGGVLGAGIAGATIKGVRGEIIATVLGFQTAIGMGSGASSSAKSAPQMSQI
jgi:hypothetical protein